MTAETPGKILPQGEKGRGYLLGLEGGQAQSLNVGLSHDAPDKGAQSVSIGADLGSGQHYLSVAPFYPRYDLCHCLVGWQAAFPAPDKGYNTVGAKLVASLVHLYKATGSMYLWQKNTAGANQSSLF